MNVCPGMCARQPACKPGRQKDHCAGKPASRVDMPGSERSSSRAFQRYLNIAIGQGVREQQRSVGPGRHRICLPCTKLTTSLCIEQQVQRGSTNVKTRVWLDASSRGGGEGRTASDWKKRRPSGKSVLCSDYVSATGQARPAVVITVEQAGQMASIAHAFTGLGATRPEVVRQCLAGVRRHVAQERLARTRIFRIFAIASWRRRLPCEVR